MAKTYPRIVVLSVLLFAALACIRSGTAIPTASSTLSAGETLHTLTHGGRERSYITYVPASANGKEPIPLVFVLHGGTGNAQSAIRMSGFNEITERNGFIAVYPNGTGRLSDEKLLTWNGGACCGYAQEEDVDDVGFMRAIVAELQSQTAIDAKRIYATGMSNGGILSHRLACEAADLFAAIAPVSGTLNFPPCNPSQPVSVIEFHGTEDQHVPYDGGYGPKSIVNVDFTSVQYSVGFWVSFDGCSSQPQTISFNDIRHEIWTGCADSTSVELYTIIGGGHSWPGGPGGLVSLDKPTTTISASELIWEFFAAHPKL
jgi:polyhydroxybutyrate depolymerase